MQPGAYISVIVPGGPAYLADILCVGDHIFAIDGKEYADRPFQVCTLRA